jgi:hypothetical protein
VRATTRAPRARRDDWFARDRALRARTLRGSISRREASSRSSSQGSAFAGTLFELALAADRSYMKAGDDEQGYLALSPCELRAAHDVERPHAPRVALPRQARARGGARDEKEFIDAERALELGLVTFTPDEIDWDDEVRLAIEERASLSPDALTGMEANLRFCGPETLETKIFARLSAWQNWIFQRPNAVGRAARSRCTASPSAPSSTGAAPERASGPSPQARSTPPSTHPSHLQRLARGGFRELSRQLREDSEQRRSQLRQEAPARARSLAAHFIDWWKEMGPEGFQEDQVYLRTAVSVDADGWASTTT